MIRTILTVWVLVQCSIFSTAGADDSGVMMDTTTSPYGLGVSSELPWDKRTIDVLDSQMAYIDAGEGPVILLLHGNPTSSYLWRNVIPHLNDRYRTIAPDLIGMGDSGKPDLAYTFADHARYLDAFIDALGLQEMTLVVHDWGSALGMRYARLNPERVQALAMMEAIVPPAFPVPSYEAMGEIGELFRAFRTPGKGEAMVLEQNYFVEEVLPKLGVARGLSEAEMQHYRRPFPDAASRLPVLQWPREVPIGGEPANTTQEVLANGQWLQNSTIPKLLFYAKPGAINPEEVVQYLIGSVPNLETHFLGHGLHFLQEDHPEQIGRGVRDWLRRIAVAP